ncbi:MAG: response regulator [Kiritimatiellaeota bacterium]|nr:response regulator [Kiritimatiellota bacterium]
MGEGTTFKIYIPALDSEDGTVEAPAQVVTEVPVKGCGQRILLVEDEPGVREFALRVLRENNYDVTAAECVTEGLNLYTAAKQPFEMVLSDVVLPDGNGLDLVEQLLAKQPGLRVLMASGYTDERSRWPAIQLRGLRFLPKPYPVALLLRTVYEVLSAPLKNS